MSEIGFHVAHSLGRSLVNQVGFALSCAPRGAIGFIVQLDEFGREIVQRYTSIASLIAARRIDDALVFALAREDALTLFSTIEHAGDGGILGDIRARLIADPARHSLVITCAAGVVVAARCPLKKAN